MCPIESQAAAYILLARTYVCASAFSPARTYVRAREVIATYVCARKCCWNLLSALDSVVKNAKIFRFCCLLWILLSKTTYDILNKLKCLDSVIFDSVKK